MGSGPPDEPSPVSEAEAAAAAGRLSEALQLLDEALRRTPGLERAHLARCGILRALGRRAEALSAAERFALALPRSASAHHQLGLCLSEAGRHEEAVQAFRRAVELNPRMLQAWKDMGISLGRMGKLEEAFRCYERASGRTPELSVPAPRGQEPSGLETALHERVARMVEGGGGCVRVETEPPLTFRVSVLLLKLLLIDWDMDGVVLSLGRPAEVYRRALAPRLRTGHPPHFVEVVAGAQPAVSGGGGEELTTLSAFEPHKIDAAVRFELQRVAERYGGEEHFVLVDELAAMEFYNGRDVVRRFVAGFLGELAALGICCFIVLPASKAIELLGPLPLHCQDRIRVRAEWVRD